MTPLKPNEPFKINLLSLNCHSTVSGKETDQIFIKYNDRKLYPVKDVKYIEFRDGSAHKFQNLSLEFPGRVDLDTVVLELWYKKNFLQNELAGRFFFMLNISEIGFSATQLIRSTSQEQSHYLIHWEMRSLKDEAQTVEKTQESKISS